MPEDWRIVSVSSLFKKGRKKKPTNYGPGGLTSVTEKMMEYFILDVISKEVEEKRVIRSSQRGLTNGKSGLTDLVPFYFIYPHLFIHPVYFIHHKFMDPNEMHPSPHGIG